MEIQIPCLSLLKRIDLVLKRIIDRIAALVIVTAFFPILLAIGIAICIESKGGVLFISDRLGLGGRTFRCYKFRTMKPNSKEKVSDDLKTVVEQNDPRLTKVGRFLRIGLDELPQIINVLKGDMSLVGPRPDAAWMLPKYKETTKGRLAAQPGITGLGVILDNRSLTTEEGYIIDLWYVQHRNLLLDTSIVLATPFYMIGFHDLWVPIRKKILSHWTGGPLLKKLHTSGDKDDK